MSKKHAADLGPVLVDTCFNDFFWTESCIYMAHNYQKHTLVRLV